MLVDKTASFIIAVLGKLHGNAKSKNAMVIVSKVGKGLEDCIAIEPAIGNRVKDLAHKSDPRAFALRVDRAAVQTGVENDFPELGHVVAARVEQCAAVA